MHLFIYENIGENNIIVKNVNNVTRIKKRENIFTAQTLQLEHCYCFKVLSLELIHFHLLFMQLFISLKRRENKNVRNVTIINKKLIRR